MQATTTSRRGIPFFHQKTELEFQQDIYESYNDMVLRQSALHLADSLWGSYPFQPILDFAVKHYPEVSPSNVLEIGCGVGRWIANLAKQYPTSTCWGIDYSYQMLKRANEFWVDGKEISIDLTNSGLGQKSYVEDPLGNLKFGLGKAEKLPFEDDSQDMIVNSFLIDRLENPTKSLEEMYRVLEPKGKLIAITPLNFKKASHWDNYYPADKFSNILKAIGFEILEWNEDLTIEEPLDRHRNTVSWKCLGFVVKKQNLDSRQ